MHIMVVPSWYANPRNKVHGSFFKEQFQELQKSNEKVTVAYNEIWPITFIGKVKEKRGLSFSVEDGLRTYRYKDYNFLPKNSNMFRIFNRRMEKLYLEIVKKEGKVDVIHAHSAFWGGISAAYVAKKYNIPFVLTEHSSLKYAKYVKESYVKWIKKAYDSADKIIAVGNGLRKEIENYTNTEIQVIPNLIDFSKFKEPKEEGKLHKGFNFFTLAYLVEGKGMELLIKAFAEAFKKEDVTLTIGGDGDKRAELQNLTKNLNMEDQIKFLGMISREDVAKEEVKCDAFVLASEHETFGVVYIEALALGKPVLGTRNGGAEDIIKEFNGILIENRNHEALVKGLKDMVNRAKEFDSKLIRENCINTYNADIIITQIKEVYNNVI